MQRFKAFHGDSVTDLLEQLNDYDDWASALVYMGADKKRGGAMIAVLDIAPKVVTVFDVEQDATVEVDFIPDRYSGVRSA